jgi:hypothetical protein
MARRIEFLFIAISVTASLTLPAQASPNCLKDRKPFALAGDTMAWTIFAAPGSECIQGLRWSYMQIFKVSVLKAPTKGKIVIVGPGFRYLAGSERYETDSFTLVVDGQNRHDRGKSTLEIAVKPSNEMVVSALPQRP